MKQETYDFYDRTMLKSYNLNQTMQAQLNALSNLDVFTRKHCENVAAITCRLCSYLHCSKGFTEYCTLCAYLHDLGKLFIPPEILQKPSKLTDEEYEIMKTHTTIGYNMCIRDEALRPYSAGPLYHHEALDGSGYPNHLTKEDIPYEGQIIRVADEYDAIVSKRQYKSHIDISDTLKILIENTKPKKSDTLKIIVDNAHHQDNDTKYGKNNKIIVKALLKVVLDDISFEIYNLQEYMYYLLDNIDRLNKAKKYFDKMKSAKSENKREYFLEYGKMYLITNEQPENVEKIISEYQEAYTIRKEKINKLLNEKKIIKNLKV